MSITRREQIMGENSGSKNCNVGTMVRADIQNHDHPTNYVSSHTYLVQQKLMSVPKNLYHFPQHSPNFYRRDSVLNDLENSVSTVQNLEGTFEKMIIISGFGGMGKSEIAKVLADKMKDEFDYIFWFDAQSRITLDSDFHLLLSLLKVPIKYQETTRKGMTSQVYGLLEIFFTKTMFIFDNAESLKSQPNSSFGLEEYLLPELPCKKPVFLITTRNNWHGLGRKLKIIRLDALGENEAKVCFLKYLRLKSLEIPPALTTTIEKLVYMVQGHPLGISIMGTELAAIQQNELLFEQMETRISNLSFLEDQPLEELTGKEKYERNLQMIFDERMGKLIQEEETGRDAGKILSILSLLSQDEIHVGLVNGIFSSKIFYPNKDICDRFSLADSELRVERALNLLEFNFLIQIKPGIFDIIQIHRLVLRCARKILKSLEEMTPPLENSLVLSLISEFTLTLEINAWREWRNEVLGMLSSREWNAEEKCVVSLIEIYAGIISVHTGLPEDSMAGWQQESSEEESFNESNADPIQFNAKNISFSKWEFMELMLGLPEELSRRGWILELCTRLLHRHIDDFEGPDQRRLRRWLKKCYVKCPSTIRYFPGLLSLVYQTNKSVIDAAGGELVLKFFPNTSPSLQREFFSEIRNNQKLMGLVRYFFPPSGETNVFVKFLKFPTLELKMEFLNCWATGFEACVNKVMENEEMREKLLATEDFGRALKDITDPGFKEITRNYNAFLGWGICRLLAMWLTLFCAHELTYKRFGEFVDRLIIDLPESTQSELSDSWCGRFEDIPLKLTRRKYCSRATRSWIKILFSRRIRR